MYRGSKHLVMLLAALLVITPAISSVRAAEEIEEENMSINNAGVVAVVPLDMQRAVNEELRDYQLKELFAEKAAMQEAAANRHEVMFLLAAIGGGAVVGALIDGGDGAARGALLGGVVGGIYMISVRW